MEMERKKEERREGRKKKSEREGRKEKRRKGERKGKYLNRNAMKYAISC